MARWVAERTKKRCIRCHKVKPLDRFPHHRSKSDGRGSYCKPCNVRRCIEDGHMRAGTKARRARIQAAWIEPVPRLDVFNRDGWACQLCGGLVDPSVRYPDPLAPVLDHIVPLAAGGEHSRANTQCAHAGCNALKGANTEWLRTSPPRLSPAIDAAAS